MKVIGSQNMMNMIRRTLNFVDPRLVGHGERVAYFLYGMLRTSGKWSDKQMAELLIPALFHDIGAYKTDEIDQMVEFETNSVWEHSVYGYLFLKELSPLRGLAEAVLYHHVPWRDLQKIDTPCRELAAMISLADRADILLGYGWESVQSNCLERGKGGLFCPELVELFRRADRRYQMIEHVRQGTYLPELDQLVERLSFSEEEKKQYLRMIAYSIDFRSEYMVQHTVTTVTVSSVIAEMRNYDLQTKTEIYFGALLHDIGKVAIPVSILEKPGKLTPEEMDIMRSHVDVTGQILGNYVQSAIYKIAVRHHEKLDGSGYPKGLTGADLSEPERIVAVSDIISALVRQRSYKDAFDGDKTRRILSEMAGQGKICPKITRLTLEHFDTLMELSSQYGSGVSQTYENIRKDYRRLLAAAPGSPALLNGQPA